MSGWTIAGTLTVEPATSRPELLADPVAKALAALPDPGALGVAEIDPELADTAAFCEAYSTPLSASARCVSRPLWCWRPPAPTSTA